MLRFLADENFNNQIVRGVLHRNSDVDIVRVQDVGLAEADDATVLEWAAQNGWYSAYSQCNNDDKLCL